jgi:hypothetical protein
MAKQANAGELRTLVYFRKVIKETDEECYPRVREEPVFQDGAGREVPVHCKWVNAHGAEVFSAMQLQLRQPATLTMRYSPRIQPTMLVYKGRDPVPYEVISVDDVEDRHCWLEVTVQRKGAAR